MYIYLNLYLLTNLKWTLCSSEVAIRQTSKTVSPNFSAWRSIPSRNIVIPKYLNGINYWIVATVYTHTDVGHWFIVYFNIRPLNVLIIV